MYDSTVNDMIAKDEAISAYQSNAATSDMACMHIPVANFYNVLTKYGFGEGNLDVNLADNATAKANGDFGHVKAEKNSLNLVSDKYRAYDIGEIFGRIGVKNALAGHCHFTNTSAVADNGVRYTFGLKAGLIPEATAGETGGTTFMFGENGFTAAPYYDNYANNTLTGVKETTNIIAYGETENGYRVAYGGKDNWAFIRFKTPFETQKGKTYKLTVNLRVNSLNNAQIQNFNIDDSLHGEKYLNNWAEIGENEYRVTRTFVSENDAKEFTVRLCFPHAAEQFSYDVEVYGVTLEELENYSNNALMSVKGATACENNERTEKGWNIAWNKKEAIWNAISFNTKYSIIANKEYRLTVKLRIDKLTEASIDNFYIDDSVEDKEAANSINLTNKWQVVSDATDESVVYYELAVNFTATTDSDFALRFACNYNGTYSFDVELFDITLEEITAFENQQREFRTWERTQTGAKVILDFNGWTTPTITTKTTAERGKKYLVTMNISDFNNTLQDGMAGCFIQNYNGVANEWKALSAGTNTFTVLANGDGALVITFAFNDSAKKGSTIIFTISDFTVTEAAEA